MRIRSRQAHFRIFYFLLTSFVSTITMRQKPSIAMWCNTAVKMILNPVHYAEALTINHLTLHFFMSKWVVSKLRMRLYLP